MTRPRSSRVCVDDTPWYYCVARCACRALLCGEDPFTGKSCEHRRAWLAEGIKDLAGIFTIDVTGCAAMSDHAHAERRCFEPRGRAAAAARSGWKTAVFPSVPLMPFDAAARVPGTSLRLPGLVERDSLDRHQTKSTGIAGRAQSGGAPPAPDSQWGTAPCRRGRCPFPPDRFHHP
jgi:hypothetical protein